MKRPSLTRNVIFNFINWLLPLGATFFFTPIIVRGLGAESYGIYALVTGFIAYSFYLAISRAIPFYIAEYRANNKAERVGEVVSATLAINLSVGFFALLFFLFTTDWLVTSVLNISPEYQRGTRISFYLAGGSILFMMISHVFLSIPQALHRFDIYSSVGLVTTLLIQAGNVLLVVTGYDIVALFVWNLIVTFLNAIANYLFARMLLPEAKLTLSFSRALLWKIIKFSGGVISYQILTNVLILFERSWLTRTNGHEAVTYYVVPMMIAVCLHTFTSSVAIVIFPLATEANAEQNKERLQSIYTRSYKILSFLIVFLVVTLSVTSDELLTVWLGKDFALRSSTVLIFQAIIFGLFAFVAVTWSLADGMGNPWLNVLLVLGWNVVGIPMMIWLTPKHGVIGTAYGRFFSTLVIPIFVLLVERWIFKRILWVFWGKLVLWLSVFGVLTGLIQHHLLIRLPVSLFSIGFAAGISGLFYCGALWLTPYFERNEKDWLFDIAKLKRKNNPK